MDLKDSPVKGCVLILHQFHDGKHHYVVEDVVNYKNTSAEKTFVRGDKLLQVNDMNLQDLRPEVLAEELAEGNPKMIVHKACRIEEHYEQSSPAVETFYPISKEFTELRFTMEMKKEQDLETNEVGQDEEGRQDGGIGDDVCQPENGEGEEERDMLIVTMNKTSFSVVKGRSCENGRSCHECNGTDCAVSNIILVSDSSTVKLVSRGSVSCFKQDKPLTASIEHMASHQYLRALCSGSLLYASPNPERITIYHYKSNFMDRIFRGMPVVLNFTDSNCFIRCCQDGGRTFLRVETCDKQKLKQIAKTDERGLSFVFYMASNRSRNLKFESALYTGWFMQIVNTQVSMETMDGRKDDPSFLFIIQK